VIQPREKDHVEGVNQEEGKASDEMNESSQ